MPSTKRCLYCGKAYVPDPRTVEDQKACTRRPCRRERQRRAYQAWAARNRDYDDSRRDKIRRWAKDYPDYWKRYRKNHPGYRKRNQRQTRERLRERRMMFAKQNAITRPIEGILVYLTVREMFAKPNAIADEDADDVHSAPCPRKSGLKSGACSKSSSCR